ncbi:hypothetical protein KEK_02606, partial [Mycolicibacterium thermoresistibile ATCC 19527]
MGLSIGCTNLVAAQVGNQPELRRTALQRPDGTVLTGFVERVGDPVPLVAADGSAHTADRLLVEALELMVATVGGGPAPATTIAVPAHWPSSTQWALRNALRGNETLSPGGVPPRLVSDAVAALTAVQANPGLELRGVVALLDFGGSGTSITLADAVSSFEPVDETARIADFSGDQIDQALLSFVLDSVAQSGGTDPAGTAAVGALSRLREHCRRAKERLSAETVAEVAVELPGHRSVVRVTRADLEALISEPLRGVLAGLDNLLERNRITWADVSAVVTVGGGAGIPLVTQLLSEHSQAPVVTTARPALDAAVGAAVHAAQGLAAQAETAAAPA